MKLKTKLIPLVSAASVAAVAIPLATTSCGLTRYTNMLAEYVPGVTPYEKTTIDGVAQATDIYNARLEKNTDIIRDDILYTWSQCFVNKESRDAINYCAHFTQYDMDVYVDQIRTGFSDIAETRVTFDVTIAGQGSHLEFWEDEQYFGNLMDFNFHIKCSFINPITGFAVTPNTVGDLDGFAVGMKDLYVCTLFSGTFVGPVIDCETTGSFTYWDTTATKEIQVPDFAEHDIFEMEDMDDKLDHLSFIPFYMLVGTIPAIGVYGLDPTTSSGWEALGNYQNLYFASHYFKDVKID